MNNTQYTHHHVKPMGYYKPRFAEDCGCKMSALPENPQVAMMYVPFQTDFTTYDESYLTDNDVEHIYFIDSYSKTYPTEDRARIIEYSMVPDAYTYEYFESSHLQEKLDYLCDCIRECWNSSGWVGKTQWEQFLIN